MASNSSNILNTDTSNLSNGKSVETNQHCMIEESVVTNSPYNEEEVKTELSPSQIKVSPSLKLALTGSLCAVCGDTSPTEGGFRRHYGVICCEACKCFFRRTVQMSRDYKCRFGGNCTIGRTFLNLKQVCQACRFNRCIKASMKIDSVKKFPRKLRDETNPKKSKKSSKSSIEKQPFILSLTPNGPDSAKSNTSIQSPHSFKSESDIDLSETDLSQLKFSIASPETLMYLENANVPQLFNYSGSLDNINKDSVGGNSSPKASLEESPSDASNDDLTRDESGSILIRSGSMNNIGILGVAKPVSVVPSPKNVTEGVTGLIVRTYEKDQPHNLFLPHSTALIPNSLTVEKARVGINLGATQGPDHLLIPSESSSYQHPCSPAKRSRIDSSSSAVDMRSLSYQSSPVSQYSMGGASHSAPHTPLFQNPQSQSSSRVNSPEPAHMSSVYNSHTNTPYATPSHTPIQSPLPSPPHTSYLFNQHTSYPEVIVPTYVHTSVGQPETSTQTNTVDSASVKGFLPNSLTYDVNPSNFPTRFSSPNNFLALQQPSGNAIFVPTQPAMPLRMGSLFPLVHFTNPFPPPTLSYGDHRNQQLKSDQLYEVHKFHGPSMSNGNSNMGSSVGKSPFTIVPIPSINKTQPPEDPKSQELSQIYKESKAVGTSEGMVSATPSARSSPVCSKSKPLAPVLEANVEEVLDSLRLRIRSMFKWAKAEVAGFDDLSPLDQKALLRKTVAELVMLGFARGSIAYESMLLLGSTGAVILPSNPNTGIGSVASITLQKLVVPLKVLNISDKELTLLKEVVLFNPEANGLRNREIVRQYRKRKHIELMEYTEKNSNDPGRFGDIMCLLTPLFEVGLEVTEQLRLEQFVHEGEARIDALLLMSMISGAEEMPTDSTIDQ